MSSIRARPRTTTPSSAACLLAVAWLGAACVYDVADVRQAPAASAGGAGPGGAGSSAGGSGNAPAGCPAECPELTSCDEAEGWCEVDQPESCATVVHVESATRFHGDTCAGVEVPECGRPVSALLFIAAPGATWRVQPVSADTEANEIRGDCSGSQQACGDVPEVLGGDKFAVWKSSGCGEVTVDVVPLP